MAWTCDYACRLLLRTHLPHRAQNASRKAPSRRICESQGVPLARPGWSDLSLSWFDGVGSVGSAGQGVCDWNAYVSLFTIRQFMRYREEGCGGETLCLSFRVKGIRSAWPNTVALGHEQRAEMPGWDSPPWTSPPPFPPVPAGRKSHVQQTHEERGHAPLPWHIASTWVVGHSSAWKICLHYLFIYSVVYIWTQGCWLYTLAYSSILIYLFSCSICSFGH